MEIVRSLIFVVSIEISGCLLFFLRADKIHHIQLLEVYQMNNKKVAAKKKTTAKGPAAKKVTGNKVVPKKNASKKLS